MSKLKIIGSAILENLAFTMIIGFAFVGLYAIGWATRLVVEPLFVTGSFFPMFISIAVIIVVICIVAGIFQGLDKIDKTNAEGTVVNQRGVRANGDVVGGDKIMLDPAETQEYVRRRIEESKAP